MDDINLAWFEESDEILWDNFVRSSHKGTFQHSRKFLNYHKLRFVDRSIVIRNQKEIIGVFPAAEHPEKPSMIVSHIGATYGGIIVKGGIFGEELIFILDEIKKFYKGEGYTDLLYKVTPSLYHSTMDEDEIYALFRVGGRLSRVDISAYVDINNRLKVSNQRKRSLKKSIQNKLSVESGSDNLGEFYTILEENLSTRYNAKPVHTIHELNFLDRIFANEIELLVAKDEMGSVISGVLFFNVGPVSHAQYIASSPSGYEKGGLDCIFEYQLANLLMRNKTYLSFGTSNVEEGTVLNQSLYRFKRQFGSGSVAHAFYELKL